MAVKEFGLREEVANLIREPGAHLESRFRLRSLDCEQAVLSYASFLNGMVSTPYAVLVDTSAKKLS